MSQSTPQQQPQATPQQQQQAVASQQQAQISQQAVTPGARGLGSIPPPPLHPPPNQTPLRSVSLPVKPRDPKMGTCEETFQGSNNYYLVFGGKPRADWSGIEDPDSRTMSDLCFRSLDPVAGQKSTIYRTKALSTKFEAKQSLADFQTNVWDHLVKYGLDTIGYLPDPRNHQRVLCTVKNHAQFTGDMNLVEQMGEFTSTR